MKAIVLGMCALFCAVSSAAKIDTQLAAKIAAANPQLPATAIKKALNYLAAHSNSFPNQNFMTLVNFGQSSLEKRLYLINLRTGYTTRYWVSHGSNSRDARDKTRASEFSNTMNSLQSSLGFYRTLQRHETVRITNGRGETYTSTGVYYTGAHGKSLRLQGLQRTNKNALNREIVIHGADYVSRSAILELGRLGESSGCPAMNPNIVDSVIDRIEGGSLYYIFK